MNNCVFCKIIAGEIPSTKVFENEHCLAILDINPQATEHILLFPKQHTTDIIDASKNHLDNVSECIKAVGQIAREKGLDKTGFRLVSNCGKHACQTIGHLHFHILGGEQLSGTMG